MIIFMRYEKIDAIFNQFHISHYRSQVEQILDLESIYHKLANPEFLTITAALKQKLRDGAAEEDIKIHAFALIREAACRVLGMRPFPVQILGGLVLNDGCVAEMKTGEGKTLVAIMPAYLNALSGKGVFVVTVNDYLAKRDAEQMGRVFAFAGLTTGLVTSGMSTAERKAAYQCDITYGTNSEFGFDYLRDNIAADLDDQVQPRRHFAIIDEADSILIDEARTPLIISGDQTRDAGEYERADRFIKSLTPADYEKEEKEKVITLTESGIAKAEAFYHVDNLAATENAALVHDIEKALYANGMMTNGVDYIVQNGKVVIVDQYTGRVMPSRQFSDGLHQAIEAKEGVSIKQETSTLATITYQNFFRLYSKLSGMTGTAKTEEEEFKAIYNMRVIEIPTNRPVARIDYPDAVYGTKKAKFEALIDEVIRCHEKGQPVLVGTIAVETSEFISKMLKSRKIPHEVLNAKNHLREAEIIKRAGQRGAVTIATNMAGRCTDIKLGEGIRELGGLAVLGSERHESRRIDNQLRGRSGRQGDPGYSRFFVSVQDDLMIRFGSERMEGMFAQLGDVPIESKMITKSIGSAQKRVEGHNFDIRKTLLDYDDVLRQQREIIYEQRDFILENENVHEIVHDMFNRVISNAVAANTDRTGKSPVVNLDTLIETLEKMGFKDGVTKSQLSDKSEDEITGICADAAWNIYEAKIAPIMIHVLPLEKTMVLKVIDRAWVNHIDIMSKLREGIHLRSYAEGNPLQAYVSEGYALFEDMMARISQEIVNFCLNARVIVQQRPSEAVKEETAAEETPEVKHKKKKKGKR